MKPEVLQNLLTAKVLLNVAQELCRAEDKYTSSSGLIILQDALELIFLSCLIERGVDERKSLENFSFDQLIGELRTEKINVPKSGTLKALNKQRVIIKHYGQVAEPATVSNYSDVTDHVLDKVLKQVIGKSLHEIFLHELIRDEEIRKYFANAADAIDHDNYYDALINVRRAIYVAIESEYCIYEWRNSEPNDSSILMFTRKGLKAPWYSHNRQWIAEHVFNPFDYIQLDHDRLRQDLLEWGASTQDFWNIHRLTPEVMQLERGGEWLVKGDLKHLKQGATELNARYCLDRAITLLSKKQAHHDMARWITSPEEQIVLTIKTAAPLFLKASKSSKVLSQLIPGAVYLTHTIVPSLDGEDRFASILHIQEEEPKYVSGHVDIEACNLTISKIEKN